MKPVVTLEAGEMAVVNMLAVMRHSINRACGVNNAKVGPQSEYQTELEGLVAEVAFCKWRNVWPDLSVHTRSGGADCVVDGKRIDVKATRRPDGRLLVLGTKTLAQTLPDTDIYVLGIVDANNVTFAGWAYATELLQESNLTNLGHGLTYAMEQSRLRTFKD